MKLVGISVVLAAALLLCLNCAPILATPTSALGTGAAAAPSLITVSTFDDQAGTDGKCSLREAISAANLDAPVDACPSGMGDDMIILQEGRYVLQLAGAGEDNNAAGDLDLRSNMTIVGAGSTLTIIDGGGIDRVLDIHAGAHAVVSGVTITSGATPNGKDDGVAGGGNADPGGGIRNAGDLWLLGCRVTGNRTGDGGGGGWSYPHVLGGTGGDGGGIYNRGNLTLQSSEVAQNETGNGGWSGLATPCVIFNQGGHGGGIWNDGTLLSTNSTITANRAAPSTSGDGGGVWNSGTLTITHATISANLAGDYRYYRPDAGGSGGGISNTGRLSLSHTTMSGNRAGDGGGSGRYSLCWRRPMPI